MRAMLRRKAKAQLSSWLNPLLDGFFSSPVATKLPRLHILKGVARVALAPTLRKRGCGLTLFEGRIAAARSAAGFTRGAQAPRIVGGSCRRAGQQKRSECNRRCGKK